MVPAGDLCRDLNGHIVAEFFFTFLVALVGCLVVMCVNVVVVAVVVVLVCCNSGSRIPIFSNGATGAAWQ